MILGGGEYYFHLLPYHLALSQKKQFRYIELSEYMTYQDLWDAVKVERVIYSTKCLH